MTHSSFKSKYIGKSLGNPRTGTWKGQCVSATRRYMEEVHGVRTGIWGHAKDYWNNPNVLKHYSVVKTPKTGDIVVYGANQSNIYGHIGMYDGGRLLSSNYNVPLKLTVAGLGYPNRLGYLRKKTKEKTMTTNAVNVLFRLYLGQSPTARQMQDYKKLTFDAGKKRIESSGSYKTRVAQAKQGTLKANAHLPTALRNIFKPVTTDITVNDEEVRLAERGRIKGLLDKIFKGE